MADRTLAQIDEDIAEYEEALRTTGSISFHYAQLAREELAELAKEREGVVNGWARFEVFYRFRAEDRMLEASESVYAATALAAVDKWEADNHQFTGLKYQRVEIAP